MRCGDYSTTEVVHANGKRTLSQLSGVGDLFNTKKQSNFAPILKGNNTWEVGVGNTILKERDRKDETTKDREIHYKP